MRTEWAGQMKSPDYPSYRKGLDCQWIIKVSDGNIVQVTFTDFAVSFCFYIFHTIAFLQLSPLGRTTFLNLFKSSFFFKVP